MVDEEGGRELGIWIGAELGDLEKDVLVLCSLLNPCYLLLFFFLILNIKTGGCHYGVDGTFITTLSWILWDIF